MQERCHSAEPEVSSVTCTDGVQLNGCNLSEKYDSGVVGILSSNKVQLQEITIGECQAWPGHRCILDLMCH